MISLLKRLRGYLACVYPGGLHLMLQTHDTPHWLHLLELCLPCTRFHFLGAAVYTVLDDIGSY
jgi:hypothetical protein